MPMKEHALRCKRCGNTTFRDSGMIVDPHGVIDFRTCLQCGGLHPDDTDPLQAQAHQRWMKMGMFDALRGVRGG